MQLKACGAHSAARRVLIFLFPVLSSFLILSVSLPFFLLLLCGHKGRTVVLVALLKPVYVMYYIKYSECMLYQWVLLNINIFKSLLLSEIRQYFLADNVKDYFCT